MIRKQAIVVTVKTVKGAGTVHIAVVQVPENILAILLMQQLKI